MPFKRTLLSVSLIFLTIVKVCSQGVGIGTTDPHTSAALHVKELLDKGLLIPRLSHASIGSPADGLIIYDPDLGNLVYSNNGSWAEIAPVPPGTIIMWSGSPYTLPDGWVLCDGSSYDLNGVPVGLGNGFLTPNLSGKFIVGYSGSGDYSYIGAPGGSKYELLAQEELPSHSHTITSSHAHSMSVSADPHSHEFTVTDAIKHNIGGFPTVGTNQGVIYTQLTGSKTTSAVSTPVIVGSSATGLSVAATGAGEGHENRPPYYVLAFIMKL